MTNAERQKQYRDRKRNATVTPNVTRKPRNVTRNVTPTVTESVMRYGETVTLLRCRHGLLYHKGCPKVR